MPTFPPVTAAAFASLPNEDLFAGQWPPVGEVCRLKAQGEIRRIAVSPDGRRLLAVGWDKFARLWDLATRKEIRQIQGSPSWGNAVAFLPDGTRALTCRDKGILTLWNVDTGQEIRSFRGHKQNIYNVAVSPDGKLALSCGPESTIFVWDIESGTEKSQLIAHSGGVETVAFSPDGHFAVAGTNAGQIVVWEVATGQGSSSGLTHYRELRRLNGHEGVVVGLAFCPDNRRLFSCGFDKTIRKWDVEVGSQLFVEQTPSVVTAVCPSRDGARLLSAREDGKVDLWDAGPRLRSLCQWTQDRCAWDVIFSRDERYAISAGADMNVHVWRIPPQVSIRSYDSEGLCIAHVNYLGRLAPVSVDQNAVFQLVPGLAEPASPNVVSFRSIDLPDHYLAHGDFRIRLQKMEESKCFRENATFRSVPGLAATSAVSFEAVNYTNYYLSSRLNELYIIRNDGSSRFKRSAPYYFVEPVQKLAKSAN